MSSRVLRSSARKAARDGTTTTTTATPVYPTVKRKRKLEVDVDDQQSNLKKSKGSRAKSKRKPVQSSAPASSSKQTGAPAKAKVMQNELVIREIAVMMPTEDLFSLRKTCTLWNRDFAPKHAAQHKPIVLETNVRNPGIRGCGRPLPRLISEFTKSMGPNWESTTIPPGLGAYNIHDLDLAGQADVASIFLKCGKTVTRLELSWRKLNTATTQIVRQIIFEWTPNLQELTLRYNFCVHNDDNESVLGKQAEQLKKEMRHLRKLTVSFEAEHINNFSFCPLLEDVFQSAVGLEHLVFEGSRWNPASLGRALAAMSKLPALHQLKTLDTLEASQLVASHLRLLIQLASAREHPLQLVELDTRIPYCGSDGNGGQAEVENIAETNSLLASFLATQRTTLCRLKIINAGRKVGKEGLTLPKLDNLHSLYLDRDGQWRCMVQFERETLVETFPRLGRLELNYDPYSDPRSDSDSDSPEPEERRAVGEVTLNQLAHSGVTSLKFGLREQDNDEHRVPPPRPLPALGQTWPSITKLELELQPAVFKLLGSCWTLWPNLRSLRVQVSESREYRYPLHVRIDLPLPLDELLSGIPLARFQLLRRGLGFQPTIEHMRALQTKFKTMPGISDLTQLQEFVLDCGRNWFIISNTGAYFGLGLLPTQTIQHVALTQRARHKEWDEEHERNPIPEECHRFLRNHFGPFVVLDLQL